MFALHMRTGDTMQTLRFRKGSKAWRLMQICRREGTTARLHAPNGARIA